MNNIGLYIPSIQPVSIYTDGLEKQTYNVIRLDTPESESVLSKLDVIVIDYTTSMLSGQVVGSVCELLIRIRKISNAIILVFLKEAPSIDRLIFLQFGANGVFDETIGVTEFSLILENLFRYKVSSSKQLSQRELKDTTKSLQFIPERLSVCLETGEEVCLTRLEYRLLTYLKEKAGEGSTYEEIFSFLWPDEQENRQYRLTNVVFHLRQKIEKDPAHPKYVKTIRTVGYLFCPTDK